MMLCCKIVYNESRFKVRITKKKNIYVQIKEIGLFMTVSPFTFLKDATVKLSKQEFLQS